jgi:hypothetical protein
VLLASLCRDE